MHTKMNIRCILLCGLIAAATIISLSCTALKTISVEEPEITLEGAYRKVIIQRFELDPQLAKTHPEAATQCESAALQEMMSIGAIGQIEKAGAGTLRQRYAVLLKAYVRGDVSGSGFAADIRLIDAYTGKTMRQTTLPDRSALKTGSGSKVKAADASAASLGALIGRYTSTAVAGEAANR